MHTPFLRSNFSPFRLLLALSCLLFTACVPMGLPEYFTSVDPLTKDVPDIIAASAQKGPAALVVTPSDTPYAISYPAPRPQRLGSQYFLGIFPLTSLYLQHDIESLLLEKTVSRLSGLGYRTYVVSGKHLEALSAVLRPHIIVTPSIEVSLNAYDAFFFRILSADGRLQLDYLNPQGSIIRTFSETIDRRSYRRTGFAPALARLLEDSVTRSLGSVIDQARTGYIPRARLGKDRAEQTAYRPALIILPSAASENQAAEIGPKIADSYGFNGAHPTSLGVIRRLLQRGLESSSHQGGFAAAAAVGPFAARDSDLIPEEKTLWYVASAVERMLIATSGSRERLELELILGLHEQSASGHNQLVSLKRCQASVPVIRGVDGFWAVTLERASADIGRRFFDARAPTDFSTECTDLIE